MFISFFLSIVFTILGSIHFNWALGGKFGFENSLPTNENGERVLNPKKIDSALVGLILFCFGGFYVINVTVLQPILSPNIRNIIGWIIPSVFILRAIGDFKYIGFSKRIKNTPFGKIDTLFYSPLCFIIGILGILIQFLK